MAITRYSKQTLDQGHEIMAFVFLVIDAKILFERFFQREVVVHCIQDTLLEVYQNFISYAVGCLMLLLLCCDHLTSYITNRMNLTVTTQNEVASQHQRVRYH